VAGLAAHGWIHRRTENEGGYTGEECERPEGDGETATAVHLVGAHGTFLVVKPDIGVAPCLSPLPSPAGSLHDGVSLYLPPRNRYAPTPTRQPIASLQHGTTTIIVYTEVGDQNALDLFVHRSGSTTTHVLTVGLGRDGRVAAGVLASIQATT